MALAIFDLDNTLIAGDSDFLWGEFLQKKGIVDSERFAQQNAQFYSDYQAGSLDIYAYQRFALEPLAKHSMHQLQQWRQEFLTTFIDPILLPKAQDLVNQHKQQGDQVLIITATNSFITLPIGERYGIKDLLGTEPEIVNNQFTGEVVGTPTFQEGKVTRLNEWLQGKEHGFSGSYFYSDSHNDIPLLQKVSHPIVVDGDAKLRAHAQKNNWDCISLR